MTASSIYFQSLPYGLDPLTQLIDYKGLATQAKIYKPRLLICGASAYPRDWDYKALRAVADEHGAFLMADIAHTSGLVAAGELADPFQYCDVVTTTTYVLYSVTIKFASLMYLQTQDSPWSPCWPYLLPQGQRQGEGLGEACQRCCLPRLPGWSSQ